VTRSGASGERWVRGALVALSTIAVVALALVGPVLARGDAWRSASWSAWPGPLAPHPSTADSLSWLMRAGWCVALGVSLLAVPYLVWRTTLGADARVPRMGLPTVAPLLVGPRGWRAPLRDAPGVLRGAALVLAVLALGRPQSVLRGETEEEKGIDIILVLDLSGSMSAVMDAGPNGALPPTAHASGHRPTRLDVAKDVLVDFVRRRKSDRIGVVVFAKRAFVLSPPTLDYGLIASLVSRIELGVIDANKTAIGDAMSP
jgi:Ca-activated chloride channel family protein